ncbi:MAG: DUF4124 domain-containing protein [Gammaproteobacteria bacterium]
MNMKWACLAMLLAGAGLCAVAQADQVYRWVDAQGNVHYSQTPPPGAVTKAKLVDVEPPPPDPTGVQQQQKLVTSVNAAAAEQQTAAAKAQQEAEKKAQQQQRCDAARKQLQGYMETHRVIANGNSANPTYYTGDDLVKFREQAQQQVDKLCAGTGN